MRRAGEWTESVRAITGAQWVSLGVLAALLVVGLAAGAARQYARAQATAAELDDARHGLAAARLHVTLGAAALGAERGEYERARQHASAFFTGLQDAAATAPPPARPRLDSLLARRDTVITMLARGDRRATAVLGAMFAQVQQVAGAAPTAPGDTAAPPAPGTARR